MFSVQSLLRMNFVIMFMLGCFSLMIIKLVWVEELLEHMERGEGRWEKVQLFMMISRYKP